MPDSLYLVYVAVIPSDEMLEPPALLPCFHHSHPATLSSLKNFSNFEGADKAAGGDVINFSLFLMCQKGWVRW